MKKLKCGLFAERSSSNLFDANTVRLYLSTFAHVLYNRLRQALAETPLSRASPTTLRLRLLKIGARVRISARRIHVAISSSCPDKTSFAAAWKALVPMRRGSNSADQPHGSPRECRGRWSRKRQNSENHRKTGRLGAP